MSANRDPDARAKWYRPSTTIRTLKEVYPLPEYMFKNEYVFEYLASLRVQGRFLPDWLSYPVTFRRDMMKLIDEVVAEEKDNA